MTTEYELNLFLEGTSLHEMLHKKGPDKERG